MASKINGRVPLFLGGIASFLAVAFLFFGFIIPQTPGRLTRPSAALFEDYALWSGITAVGIPVPQNSETVALLVVAFSLVCFLAYGVAVYFCWKHREDVRIRSIVLGASVVFFFISVWFLPNFNTDIFNYILRGRVVAVYESNPYYDAGDAFSDDPIYEYASHRYTAVPGGKFPAWMHINIFLASIAGDSPLGNLLLYRAFFFIVNLLNLGLIWRILMRLNPSYVMPALLMYAWNPIVVLNGQSKTDTVMVFYLLLAVCLLVYERHRLATVALSLSVFVKLLTGPLLLVYLLRELALKRWRSLLVSIGLIVGTVIVLYMPFWDGPSLLTHHIQALGESGTSVPGAIKTLMALMFVALVFWIGLIQNGSTERLLDGWAFLMLYFALFMTKLGLAWYLMTLIALVSLSFNPRLTVIMIVLSFSSFLFNSWYSTFSSQFKVEELFALPKLLVYIALPAIPLLWFSIRGGYRKSRILMNSKSNPERHGQRDDHLAPGVAVNSINRSGDFYSMLRVLTYHRVANPEDRPMLDPRIISSTPVVFAQHMNYLKKYYNVVSMQDVLDAVEGKKRLSQRAILITFDDAYCDFKENAWPVLKRLNLPVTVFVPTAYPDQNERCFWWDKLYRCVIHTEKSKILCSPIGTLTLQSVEERQQSLRRLQQYIKTLPHSEAMALVEQIAEELEVGSDTTEKTVLSWDELRQLAKEGVTLGAHTRTHPIMTQLSLEQVREEVSGSFTDLQRQLGEVLPIFCYPNGSHDDDIVQVLEEDNFKLAFTVIDGINDLEVANPLRLRRTNITRKSTLPVLKLRLQKWYTYIDMWRHRERHQVSHR